MYKRYQFSNREEEAIRKYVDRLKKIMLPHAEKTAKATFRSPHSCFASLLRPYIEEAVNPEKLERTIDNRTREWEYKIMFWDISEGLQNGEIIAETEVEKDRGLNAIGKRVRECVSEVHADEGLDVDDFQEFSKLNMKRRLGGIRPAITRGGGSATLRIYYETDPEIKYLCQVDLSRVT